MSSTTTPDARRAFITGLESRQQPGELAGRLAELVDEYRGGTVPIELRVESRPPQPLDPEPARQLAPESFC